MPPPNNKDGDLIRQVASEAQELSDHFGEVVQNYNAGWVILKELSRPKAHAQDGTGVPETHFIDDVWQAEVDGSYRVLAGIEEIQNPVATFKDKEEVLCRLGRIVDAIGEYSFAYAFSCLDAFVRDSAKRLTGREFRDAQGAIACLSCFLQLSANVADQCQKLRQLRNDLVHNQRKAGRVYSLSAGGMKNYGWNQETRQVSYKKGELIKIGRLHFNVIIQEMNAYLKAVKEAASRRPEVDEGGGCE